MSTLYFHRAYVEHPASYIHCLNLLSINTAVYDNIVRPIFCNLVLLSFSLMSFGSPYGCWTFVPRGFQIMRGLAEHLGLLVLQQRGATAVLESELWSLIQEVDSIQSLSKAGVVATTSASVVEAVGNVSGGVGCDEVSRNLAQALPPQAPLRSALETQRVGLLRGVEAIRQVKLLVKAIIGADPPAAAPKSGAAMDDLCGLPATDATTSLELVVAVEGLENSVGAMLICLQGHPSPAAFSRPSGSDGSESGASPLLNAGVLDAVVAIQEKVRACSAVAKTLSERYADVVPPSVLIRVATHLDGVCDAVQSALSGNLVMAGWVSKQGSTAVFAHGEATTEGDGACTSAGISLEEERTKVALHASKIGDLLSESVKAMLLSVQGLCPRDSDKATSRSIGEVDGVLPSSAGVVVSGAEAKDDDEKGGWSTDFTLVGAHVCAFNQAKELKLWRCSAALAAATRALKEFSEDKAVNGVRGSSSATREAGEVLGGLCAELMQLAEQVVSAAKAVLIGMIALNKVCTERVNAIWFSLPVICFGLWDVVCRCVTQLVMFCFLNA